MYDLKINTSISILGHVFYVTYAVTREWAVEWYLSPQEYEDAGDCEIMAAGIEGLETLLRVNYNAEIVSYLMSEFDARQYEADAKAASLAEMEEGRIF